MSMVIQHNIPALQSYNIVNNTSNALQKSIAKLSSGLRINSAADDAAGLAISEKMRSQVRGLDRAVANTQDGISLIQTAEGALQETHSILQRMRELSVQAANDTLTQQDRSYIQEEVDQLKEEITRIGNTTQFNKKKLLNGDSAALWSSDNLETKAIINGGLRDVDQFGQKKSVEGNYKIRIKADPGQGEVQKSDIMKIKHSDVLTNKTVNAPDGIKDVETDNMTPGTYTMKLNSTATAPADVVVTGSYGIGGTKYVESYTLTGSWAGTPQTQVDNDGGTTGALKITMGATTLYDATLAAGSTAGTNQTAIETAMNNAATAAGIKASFKVTASGIEVTQLGSDPTDLTMTYTGATTNGTTPIVKSLAKTTGGTNPATSEVKATEVFEIKSETNNTYNASVLVEVQSRDTVNGTANLKITANLLDQSGVATTKTQDNVLLKAGDAAINLSDIFGGSSTAGEETVTIALKTGMIDCVEEGGKFVAYVSPAKSDNATNAINVDLTGTIDSNWEDSWDNGPFNKETLQYHFNADELNNTEVQFNEFIVNSRNGKVSQGSITLSTDDKFKKATLTANKAEAQSHVLASFTNTYIGKVANGDVKLRDLDKFWNSEGVSMLDDAKKITLNQGDGKSADIMLYANDTLDEVAAKINDAIATGLGQSKYVDDATNFATFVSGNTLNSSEAVPGTFVIRSVVPGEQGEITFSGDQGVLDAFSLNTIQNSKETVYNVDVFDEHSGKIIAQNVKTTGNVLHGVIHENVDVEFGALSGVSANWNDNLKKYIYTSEMESTTLHLADNTTVLQIGANEGEDIGMNIGDMRSHALGLDGVNVMSHDRAARAITLIDNAIDKVSTQRANLGAYQNRLEHTASSLTIASENLTSAESRIRDADMAKEMMNFTRLNIMLQAGNSMLAQANQQPQNVLSLIR